MIESVSNKSLESQNNISTSYYYSSPYGCSNQQYYYPATVNNSYNPESATYNQLQPSVYSSEGYMMNNYYYNSNSINYCNNLNYSQDYHYNSSQLPTGSTISPNNSSTNPSTSSSYLSIDTSTTFSPVTSTKVTKSKKNKQTTTNMISTSNCGISQEVLSPTQSSLISTKLSNSYLWDRFNKHTTEMIITKQGRRMFPILQYHIFGLEKDKKYNVFVDVVQVDQNIWKFQGNRWMPCGLSSSVNEKNDLLTSAKSLHGIYLHPDSPNTGDHWMKNEIAFSKIKLTNNRSSPLENHLILNSMHKYIPRLHICLADDARSIKTFSFPETEFIAVTAYQNADITQLKIENNPFAKGFRDNPERSYENSILVSSSQYSQMESSCTAKGPESFASYKHLSFSNQQQYHQYSNSRINSQIVTSISSTNLNTSTPKQNQLDFSTMNMISKHDITVSPSTYTNYHERVTQKRFSSNDEDLESSKPAKRFTYDDSINSNHPTLSQLNYD